MSDELRGQVAIITGGGRGIGRAIARAFAAAGASVAITARSEDQLAETVSLIEQQGGRAFAHAADVTDRFAAELFVAETERLLGKVDLLVNNAGVAGPIGPLWENEPDERRRSFGVNVEGPFLYARAVLPGMVARGRGHVINSPAASRCAGTPT